MIDVSTKREFIQWLVKTIKFPKREVYWLLNYLVTHDTVLENIHFVEQVEKTSRGLRFSSEEGKETMVLFLNQQAFTNPEQIFHEVRMNWREELYIECDFPDNWYYPQYVSVLEDNPYASWNSQADVTLQQQVEEFLAQEKLGYEIQSLYKAIDQALEDQDTTAFYTLTEQLKIKEMEMKEGILHD